MAHEWKVGRYGLFLARAEWPPRFRVSYWKPHHPSSVTWTFKIACVWVVMLTRYAAPGWEQDYFRYDGPVRSTTLRWPRPGSSLADKRTTR